MTQFHTSGFWLLLSSPWKFSKPWLGIHIFIYHIYGQLLALVWLNPKTTLSGSQFSREPLLRDPFFFFFFKFERTSSFGSRIFKILIEPLVWFWTQFFTFQHRSGLKPDPVTQCIAQNFFFFFFLALYHQ